MMPRDGGTVRPETPKPASRIICTRCRVGEITYGDGVCPLCGFSPSSGQVAQDPLPAAIDQAARRELADHFKIERLLGRGGMSMVYLAREPELSRQVAVKVLPMQLSLGEDGADRFKREAKIGAALDHPHIVPVHRVGTTPSFLWYSMKWVRGGSLRDLLDQKGPMSLTDCVRLLEPVADALHYAHRRGVIHRDIKPANVLIDDTGWVGICDFGIAKMFGATPLTNTGAAVGTPGYMAPEQCYGRPLDGRSDQYALGVLAFECLAGEVPFTGDSFGEMVRKHCMEPPPRITSLRPDVPEAVADALVKAMSKRPEERFDSTVAFVRALGGDPGRFGTLPVVPAVEDNETLSSAPTQPIARHPARTALAWGPVLLLGVVIGGLVLLSQGGGAGDRAPALGASPAVAAVEPGRVWVGSTPWGELFVDGRRMGQTPAVGLELQPGRHHLRIARPGYRSYEWDIEIASGDEVRSTGIVLKRLPQP